MKEILAFFKDIFMISDESSKVKIGLAQFKEEKEIKPEPKKIKKFDAQKCIIKIVFRYLKYVQM